MTLIGNIVHITLFPCIVHTQRVLQPTVKIQLSSKNRGCNTRKLAKRYALEVDVSTEVHWAHKPPRGYVTVLKLFLKFGVQFSLNQLFWDVLRFYGLTVFQVMPE